MSEEINEDKLPKSIKEEPRYTIKESKEIIRLFRKISNPKTNKQVIIEFKPLMIINGKLRITFDLPLSWVKRKIEEE